MFLPKAFILLTRYLSCWRMRNFQGACKRHLWNPHLDLRRLYDVSQIGKEINLLPFAFTFQYWIGPKYHKTSCVRKQIYGGINTVRTSSDTYVCQKHYAMTPPWREAHFCGDWWFWRHGYVGIFCVVWRHCSKAEAFGSSTHAVASLEVPPVRERARCYV